MSVGMYVEMVLNVLKYVLCIPEGGISVLLSSSDSSPTMAQTRHDTTALFEFRKREIVLRRIDRRSAADSVRFAIFIYLINN